MHAMIATALGELTVVGEEGDWRGCTSRGTGQGPTGPRSAPGSMTGLRMSHGNSTSTWSAIAACLSCR